MEKIFYNYGRLLTHKAICCYCLISALSYGIMFSYLGLAPHYFISQMGVSLTTFGYLIVANAFVIFLMTAFTPKLSRRIGYDKTLLIGSFLLLAGAVSIFVSMKFFEPNMWSLTLSALISFCGVGIIRPTGSAGVMHAAPADIAGSAAAVYGFFSFAGSAAVITVSSFFCHVPYEFGIFSAIFSIVAIGLSLFLRK